MSKAQTPKKGCPTMSRRSANNLRRAGIALLRAEHQSVSTPNGLDPVGVAPEPEVALCDGCGQINMGVQASDDGRGLFCPTCFPEANTAGMVQDQKEAEKDPDSFFWDPPSPVTVEQYLDQPYPEVCTVERYNEKSRKYKKVTTLAFGTSLSEWSVWAEPGKYRVKGVGGTVVDSIDTRVK